MTGRRRPPRELTLGLEPVRIGLLRDDHDEAYALATAERGAEITRRLDMLREWYGIAAGPDCWRELCLAMAAERFPGFRDRAARKPRKWTFGTLMMLAGEMLRVKDAGACTQAQAAERLANSEPWKRFLAPGRWGRKNELEPFSNLLEQYTHMPKGYRNIGEDAYLMHAEKGTLADWHAQVRDFLEQPD
jgi:hypothetical protein